MATLNHINLAVPHVPELCRFFEVGFNFRVVERRDQGKLAVLRNEENFLLILMQDRNTRLGSYPALFHVGFDAGSVEHVYQHYQRLIDAGFDSPEPAKIERAGPPVFGFYCTAPGGVVVEVSTMDLAA
ncbi:Glyoxalase/Bleomycin resistance protein/Dioxygenase superfamily protein [Granulicella rosea]|uniref:Glyoxalase/Bleomycin resistance protein/Dioxygenase superfamily protein n=1 Tax=Granulicella rosea TaxID=474952 RepID=A0A239KLE6_9BACT|nr:VOC family protein [Granulicella rosea]SNT18820.1 Glyoxalase/Bleomycin resistance protein/Dioxygenase superfamily protein [Granulicella rosea]